MRAYVNERGYVVAVFKIRDENYQMCIRRGSGSFVIFDKKTGRHSTRAEAEAAMDKWYKCRCSDGTYRLRLNWCDGE